MLVVCGLAENMNQGSVRRATLDRRENVTAVPRDNGRYIASVGTGRSSVNTPGGRKQQEGRKLHLGCFNRPIQGWVNTDITPHLLVAQVPGLAWVLYHTGRMSASRWQEHRRGVFKNISYLSLTKPFPYPGSSFQAVFSSHVLEHLFPDAAEACVREMFRVLQPGGICRIVVPDLDKIIAQYDPHCPDAFLKRILEWSPRGSRKNMHHWHYNNLSLLRLLREVGFQRAYRCDYRQGSCPDLELLDNRPDESLFVEAIK